MAEQTKTDEIEKEIHGRIQSMKAEQEKNQMERGRAKAENAQLRTDTRMGSEGAPALGGNGV